MGEAMKKYLYRIAMTIDPNKHHLKVTKHEIVQEFKEEICVTPEEGRPYIHRVSPLLGVIEEHSNPGGWLDLDVWVREPSEVDAAKRLVMAAMDKKIEKYEQEAWRLRSKFRIVILRESGTNAVDVDTETNSGN